MASPRVRRARKRSVVRTLPAPVVEAPVAEEIPVEPAKEKAKAKKDSKADSKKASKKDKK